MKILFLGHAGFLVETNNTILLMDPWLSKEGAFSNSWYQYPCNHHLNSIINKYFSNSNKNKFIYISHEHNDHFDRPFLNSIDNKNFKFIIPKYRNCYFENEILKIKSNGVLKLEHLNTKNIGDIEIEILIDDSGINTDSGIIVSKDKFSFLNLNDCKLYDTIIDKKYKSVFDIVTCQFSGATWFPICYDFDQKNKDKLLLAKQRNKFKLVKSFLKKINFKFYLPSAGPPCFLSENIRYINFIKPTQFPFKEDFLKYLYRNKLPYIDMNPGDIYEYGKVQNKYLGVNYGNDLPVYINNYSKNHIDKYSKKRNIKKIFSDLIKQNSLKLNNLQDKIIVPYNLFFAFNEDFKKVIKVDFTMNDVNVISYEDFILERKYYLITAPAWLYERVLKKEITWSEFALTFRMHISRIPNIYSSEIQLFILSQENEIKSNFKLINEKKISKERVLIDTANCKYEIDRFCPHMNADLTKANIIQSQYVVCPRHGWEFDLYNKGECKESFSSSINSILVKK